MYKIRLGKTGLMVSRVGMGGIPIQRARKSYENYQSRIMRLTHKINVLKEHCRRSARDYDDIEVTVLCPMEVSENGLSPEDVTEMCVELGGIGVHQVILNMINDHEITPIRIIGTQVIPRIGDIREEEKF